MITDALNEVKRMAALAAQDLRERAPSMSGTEIIAEEEYIPDWSFEKDYAKAPVGTPVKFNGQDYSLLQPHTPSHFPGQTPETLFSLWDILHTTDPLKAKPWVKPQNGTWGMYHEYECMIYTDGLIYKCRRDTVYSPEEYGPDWEVVE